MGGCFYARKWRVPPREGGVTTWVVAFAAEVVAVVAVVEVFRLSGAVGVAGLH